MIDTMPHAGTTVLVAEDDDSLRILFGALLRRHGFLVDFVSNAAEVAERVARHDYDVVLLDLRMPDVSGFDVLRHFARHQPHLLQRTIVATGVGEKVLQSLGRNSVFAVLRKPFDLDELEQTIVDCANRGAGEELHRETVRRFGAKAPELRRFLRDASASAEELLLREELRKVVGALGGVLESAAAVTPNAALASGFTRMARTARELSMLHASRGHEH